MVKCKDAKIEDCIIERRHFNRKQSLVSITENHERKSRAWLSDFVYSPAIDGDDEMNDNKSAMFQHLKII